MIGLSFDRQRQASPVMEKLARLEASVTIWDGAMQVRPVSGQSVLEETLEAIDEIVLLRCLIVRRESGETLRLTVSNRRLMHIERVGAAGSTSGKRALDPEDEAGLEDAADMLRSFTEGCTSLSLSLGSDTGDCSVAPGVSLDRLRDLLGTPKAELDDAPVQEVLDRLMQDHDTAIEAFLLLENGVPVRSGGASLPSCDTLFAEMLAEPDARAGGSVATEDCVIKFRPRAVPGGYAILFRRGDARLALLTGGESAEAVFDDLRARIHLSV